MKKTIAPPVRTPEYPLGMKGCQLWVSTLRAAPKMNSRMAPTLMITMMVLARADSRTPRTSSQVSSITIRNAGRLNHAPVALPSMKIGWVSCERQVEAEDVVEQIVEVRAEADGHGHVADGVFEDQVPADDPGEDLAQGRVGVGVGAARDRNHGGQFRVAQRREAAGDGHQQEGERDGGTGAGPSEGADGVAAAHEQVEHRGFEDRREVELESGGGGAGEGENAGPDDEPIPSATRLPSPRDFFEAMRWVVAGRDQCRDALGAKESGHAASGGPA